MRNKLQKKLLTAAIALTIATLPILGAGQQRCEDDRICFYVKERFEGDREEHPTAPDCKNLTTIPVAKSVDNWTGETVALFESDGCAGKSIKIEPDTSISDTPAKGIPAIRAFKG